MNKKIPMRMCVGCREMKEKNDLIRVVKTPEDDIVIDTVGKLNGRGAYICKNEECLRKAFKNRGIERSFKMSVSQEIADKLTEEMKTIE